MFAGLINIFYQWPIFFLSSPIEASLAHPYQFSLVPAVVVLSLLAWVVATGDLNIPADTISDRRLSVWQMIVPVLAATIFTGIYFARVPFRCTALFALLYDPVMTLLAREVTIKFAGSTLATSSYGALANTVAPAVAAIGVAQIVRYGSMLRIVPVVIWAFLIFVSISLVMIAGAKGLTIPLIVTVFLSALLWSSSWKHKVVSGAFSLLCVFAALSSFEVIRERGGGTEYYDFAGCVVSLGSIEKGWELLDSMGERGGLGLDPAYIQVLRSELRDAISGLGRAKSITRGKAAVRPIDSQRVASYIEALTNRALVIPTQVAAWHFLYVDEYGSPGYGALPFAKKLLGYSVDASSLVYMAYGTVYSDGDRTSTSTAPTSFIFWWFAYFGLVGLVAAIVCILILDGVVAIAMRESSSNVLPLSVGLVFAISLNLITSDFFVVMLSHGGAVAVGLIIFFALLRGKGMVVA